MQYLEIVAKIAHRSAEEIYPILCDFDSYAKNSQAVHSITSQVLSDGRTVSTWEVDFRGGVMSWIEEDLFDASNYTISFNQIEGDVEHFCGQWKAQNQKDGCLILFLAEFDMGIPSLSQILDPIAIQALQENITAIIRGLFGEEVEFLPVQVTSSSTQTPNQVAAA
ncbi:SRPBCC family protein [Fortiea contorta]|uniref:SRPBCC family protein n=1 Tax=Fortiea contorta TaxID=1892405 RepID=UPI00034BFA15|nr:SRPBCC family protein [Fortiea contorta]